MTNKNIIVSTVLALLVIGGALYVGVAKREPGISSPLHAQLAETYSRIPTDAGKANFLKQSNNLTQKVDPELG